MTEYNGRGQPDAIMNTKLVAATSAAAFLGVLAGFVIGAREIRTLRTDFETRAKILEKTATDSQRDSDQAAANARSLEVQLAVLEKSKAHYLNESNARLRDVHDLKMKLQQLELGQAHKDKLSQLQAVSARDAFGRIDSRRPLRVDEVVTIAHAFHDIQHHVAAGEFPGLNLTVAYTRLKELLDNQEIDQLIADYDTASGR